MSSLSILVPRMGNVEDFETTLAAILRYRLPRHQVIVVHDLPPGDPYGLAGEVDFVSVPGEPGLVKWFNAGAACAQGEFINLICPGVEVTERWFLYAIRALRSPGVGSAIPAIMDPQQGMNPTVWGIGISVGMNRRVCRKPSHPVIGPSRWAGFYRRETLSLIGPLDESLSDDYLDVDLALSLRKLGLGTVNVSQSVCRMPNSQLALSRPTRRGGRDAQRMVQRYLAGRGRAASVRTAAAVTAELAGCPLRPRQLAQVLGRLDAKTKRASDFAHGRRLELVQHEILESGSSAGDQHHSSVARTKAMQAA